MGSQCFCCRIKPPAGLDHPHTLLIKHGALKGSHRICEACHLEVFDVVANLVQSRHTFEVSTNAAINVFNRIERRQYFKRLEAAPQSCRLENVL